MKVRPYYFFCHGPQKSHPHSFWLKFQISILKSQIFHHTIMEEMKILGLRATQKVKINGPDYTGTKKSSLFSLSLSLSLPLVYVRGTLSWLVRTNTWMMMRWELPVLLVHTSFIMAWTNNIMRGTFLEKRPFPGKLFTHHHFHHHFSITIIMIWTLQPPFEFPIGLIILFLNLIKCESYAIFLFLFPLPLFS